MITEAQYRELAALMNRGIVTVENDAIYLVLRDPKDLARAFELLTAQGRAPQRDERRRLIVCRRRRST